MYFARLIELFKLVQLASDFPTFILHTFLGVTSDLSIASVC
jgi:hypothetical protein